MTNLSDEQAALAAAPVPPAEPARASGYLLSTLPVGAIDQRCNRCDAPVAPGSLVGRDYDPLAPGTWSPLCLECAQG